MNAIAVDAAVPALGPEEVHVWCADVPAHAPREGALGALLDAGELGKARRFHFTADRTRYVVAHGLLRLLLGAYLEQPASRLTFVAGATGKPALRPPRPLEFNLSHAADRVLIALAHRPVGVDVERWWGDVDCLGLAARFFAPAERDELARLDAAARRAAFFAAWTRKEAYVKALGIGVGDGLAADVGRDPRWSVAALAFEDGYSGAVVAAGDGWRLHTFALTPELAERL